MLTTNLTAQTDLSIHTYIHTFLPSYLPYDASHSTDTTFGLCSLAFPGFLKSRHFLPYKHLCSLAAVPGLFPVRSLLAYQWPRCWECLSPHDLQSTASGSLLREEKIGLPSYLLISYILKKLGHPSSIHFMIKLLYT